MAQEWLTQSSGIQNKVELELANRAQGLDLQNTINAI
jgi:hypothetical protein